MSAAYLIGVGLGLSPAKDFAFADQLAHHLRDFLDGHGGVHPMQVIQLDVIAAEPLQRRFQVGADLVLGGVVARCFLCPELGGNYNLVAHWLEGFAYQRFVMPVSITFGRVEVGAAALESMADQTDCFITIGACAVAVAETHASNPDCRDRDISQKTLLHVIPPCEVREPGRSHRALSAASG